MTVDIKTSEIQPIGFDGDLVAHVGLPGAASGMGALQPAQARAAELDERLVHQAARAVASMASS